MFSQAIKILGTDQFSSVGGSQMQIIKEINKVVYKWEDNLCMAYVEGKNGQGLGYSEEEARLELQDSWDSLLEYEEELVCLSIAS